MTTPKRLGITLSDDAAADLSKLLIPFDVGNDNLKWSEAIHLWFDAGDISGIESLLLQKKTPPECTLLTLAHIIGGKPRGVSNRHISGKKRRSNRWRDMLALHIKNEIKQKVKAGEIKKKKGVSYNAMVAEEFNKLFKSTFGSLTERNIENLKNTDIDKSITGN